MIQTGASLLTMQDRSHTLTLHVRPNSVQRRRISMVTPPGIGYAPFLFVREYNISVQLSTCVSCSRLFQTNNHYKCAKNVQLKNVQTTIFLLTLVVL